MNQPPKPERIGQPATPDQRIVRTLGRGTRMETELTEPGYLSTEFMTQVEPFFVPRTGRIFGGCGDDRPLTAESARALTEQYADLAVLNPAEGFASIYGGLAGITKNVAIVGTMQNPSFLEAQGGLAGITETLLTKMAQDTSEDAVFFGLHSAEDNEKDERGQTDRVSFCAHGDAATSSIMATDALAQQTARGNQIALFGNDDRFDDFIAAHQALVTHEGAGRAVDRTAYIGLLQQPVAGTHKLPFMMLEGAHTSARTSGVVFNFDQNTVGSARKAHDAGNDIYREDVAVAAEVARKAFPELDAELLLRSFVVDATAVRAVLAANDADPALNGKLDPTALAIGVRGNVQQAIEALRIV